MSRRRSATPSRLKLFTALRSKTTSAAALASLAAAVLFSIPLEGAAQPDPATAQVVQMLRAQQYQDAANQADRLLASHPHDCRLLSLKGLALNGMKDLPAAKKSFDQALRACPTDLLPLEGAAQIAYAQKMPDAASLLKRILVLRPQDVTTHAMLAALDRSKEDCRDALPHFEASQSMFAEHPELQEGYAFCLAAVGQNAKALSSYQQVMEAHPNATARYNLAIVQWKMHDPGAALKTLQPLLSAGSEAPLELGSQLAEDAGDTPQAVQLLREAILRDPKNADNYLRFAELSFAHNSYKVGIDMLNAGLTQLPTAARLYLARGVLEVQLSQFEPAIADFEKAHRLEPQLSLAMDAIGIMQSQQHQSSESLKLFAEQVQRHPGDPLLQYLYAEALSEAPPDKETLNKAIAAAERSVRIDPNYEPARGLLAMLCLRANQPQRAAEAAEAALKIDPDDDTALYQEIMARRRLGQTTEVQKLVQKLTELRRNKSAEQKQKKGYVLKDEVAP